ncbi:SDR family oxidoreductase [Thermonema rossianum]|uniref:SDR family oxidoreductase n=1 Tax=Thermonema rossianum TaxID=55505 RepID=UPI000A93FC1B|nr:SDR family oxidoreductase [Thermonema rossianum]
MSNLYKKPFHPGSLHKLRFLVTGGAGFIGSHLVEYLCEHKAALVRIMDNLSTGKIENIAPFLALPNVEWVEGDIRDLDTCMQACKGIDIVLHQAALGSVPRSIAQPLQSHATNVDGFLNILYAAKEKGIRRVVFASSSSVYGDSPHLPKQEEIIGKPLSPYALTKLINEQYAEVFARTYGIEYVGLRYFNVFGPRQNPEGPYAAVIPLFMKAALTDSAPTIHGDGQQSRDFTFVSNAVKANLLAALTRKAEAINRVYNVACGKQYTVLDIWQHIARLTGTAVQPVHTAPRPGDVRHSLADIGAAQQLLGYEPEHYLEEGLAHSLAWYRALYSTKSKA